MKDFFRAYLSCLVVAASFICLSMSKKETYEKYCYREVSSLEFIFPARIIACAMREEDFK
jgi:hypothetical protein